MEDRSLPVLAARSEDSHKGDFGNALLIGGSRGMAGAIALAGMAAVRTGAGLVRLAVPDCCLETVAGFSPCPMIVPLPHDSRGRVVSLNEDVMHWIAHSDCVAIGPGLGRSDQVAQFVLDVLQFISEANPTCPVVIDADGLNALASLQTWTPNFSNSLVLTPHPGEWSRLSGFTADDRERQMSAAVSMASKWRCTIVLKGHRTLITDGTHSSLNTTGCPAMATGGSGDVLTGVITALICQGLCPYDAARLGAHLHGLAGMLASEDLGLHVVLPTELIEFLPKAIANRVQFRKDT